MPSERTSTTMHALLACATLGLATPLPAQDPVPSLTGRHAIRGARVLVEPGTAVETGTVLVENGLVTAVGPDVEIPPGTDVIAGDGLTVTAGFTAFGPQIAPKAGNGDDGGPDAEGAPERDDQRRTLEEQGIAPRVLASELLAARGFDGVEWRVQGITALVVAPTGRVVAGHAAVLGTGDAPLRERLLADRVALRAGFRGVRRGYPRSVMGVVAALRQFLHDARWLRDAEHRYREDPRGLRPLPHEPDLEAAFDVVAGTEACLFDTRRAGDVDRGLRLAAEFGLRAWVRGGGTLAARVDALARRDADAPAGRYPCAALEAHPGKVHHEPNERLLSGPPGEEAGEAPEGGDGAAPDGDDAYAALRRRELEEKEREELEELLTAGRRLVQADVAFCFAADEPDRFLEGVRAQIAWGLDRDAALAALTTTPAEILGLKRSHGKVVAGAVADLSVFAGDPFTDGRLAHVFARGTRHDIEEEKEKKKEAEADDEAAADEEAPPPAGRAALAGTWDLELERGAAKPTLELRVEGSRLVGALQGPRGVATLARSELDGASVKLVFEAGEEERRYEIVFEGTLSDDRGRITGTLGAGDRFETAFDAVRRPKEEER